jgi:hypothetical protein
MKVLAALALAAAALAAPVTTGAAQAVPGALCGFAAFPRDEDDDRFSGVLVGGPLAFPDGPVPASTGTLVCTIQIEANDTHGEADAAVITGTTSVVSTVAGTVTYGLPDNADLYLCSHVEFGGTAPVLYWDASAGGWSTSASVPCSSAFTAQAPDPGPVTGGDDAIYCPILSIAFPSEGDVVLPGLRPVWDCPPYDDDEDMRDHLYGLESAHFLYPEATDTP